MLYHSYIFFGVDSALHQLSQTQEKALKQKFLSVLQSDSEVLMNAYSILGLKHDMHIFFWLQSDSLEHIQSLIIDLMHSQLGRYLVIKHTLFGMTRQTQYSTQTQPDTNRQGGKYLIIYPFTKTKEWYMLEVEKRRILMGGHMKIGKKHNEKITQLLLYSYGIDDSEFIVSYETDDLSAFQTLVMELRSDPVRAYTEKDTPIFTGIYKPLEEVLSYL